MPATAGRVRMPANNRVHSSAALQTHGIWQSAIGYDPYAPNKEDKKDTSHMVSNAEPDAENAYANFQGLLALAKISNSNVDIDRGACKKCGRVGHLKFQCKNYVKVKDDNEEKDPEAMQVPALVALDKLKGRAAKGEKRSTVESSDESDEEEDSDSSDSDVDSEIERIIAERSEKKISRKGGSSRREDSDEDGSDTCTGKKRGRSKKRHGKREISDSDDSGERRRKRRREKRRKRDKSPDDRRHSQRKSRKEKRRRRSRRSESDSETSEDSGRRHRRKTRKAESSSDTDSSGLDSRMGRDVKKSEKSRRRHHGHDK